VPLLHCACRCVTPMFTICRSQQYDGGRLPDCVRVGQLLGTARAAVSDVSAPSGIRPFRETPPLARSRQIRLELAQVQVDLSHVTTSGTPAHAVRRYGFVNPGWFMTASHRLFGELASETARRGLRWLQVEG
jgi:hypothetical protein